MDDSLQQEPIVATIVESDPAEIPVARPSELELRLLAIERSLSEIKNTNELETRITARVLEHLPTATLSPPNGTARWYNRLNPFRTSNIPMPSGWILLDLWNELRFTMAMLMDPRFAMTWTSRGVVIAAIALAFTWSVWLSPLGLIPFLGATVVSILTTILTLFCGGLLFKILHRETQRYRNDLENRHA